MFVAHNANPIKTQTNSVKRNTHKRGGAFQFQSPPPRETNSNNFPPVISICTAPRRPAAAASVELSFSLCIWERKQLIKRRLDKKRIKSNTMGAPLSSFRPDHAAATKTKHLPYGHGKISHSDTWIMWVFNAHAYQNLYACAFRRWCDSNGAQTRMIFLAVPVNNEIIIIMVQLHCLVKGRWDIRRV